jgi:hypothetical protein
MPLPKLDVYASATHYFDHMVPVWLALPKTRRGTFYVPRDLQAKAERLGVETSTDDVAFGSRKTPILVASSGNLTHAKKAGREHVAIMEHGCGLSYGGDLRTLGRIAAESSSYAGGLNRPASLFLHPGPHPASRDRERYPKARVEIVGSPRLDSLPARVPDGRPTVAFSFHWDTAIAKETRSGFIFYRDHLAELAAEARATGRFDVIGHGHPRIIDRLAPWYERKGIEIVREFDDVCRRADLYVVDNSSTLYEFAATGRPVLVLNTPMYRRDVEHGLRFWDAAHVGENIDEPYDIKAAVPRHLANPDLWTARREDALARVYAYRTGAAKRAAKVLTDWTRSLA